MARQYKTGLIITGDASGGIRAIKSTEDELGKLNRGFERGTQRSRSFQREVGGTSEQLAVLKRTAAPLAATLAGMFAASSLKGQIDFADQLQKTNIRIGASTEALSEYRLVAKLSGVEFGQLATAWQRQTRRIAQAAEGTGEAQAALESLNLSAKDLSQLAPEQQFEHIARAMQGVASEAERVALAQKVWDSEGVKLLQIVNQGTDAIEAMRQQARDLGLSISGETANAMAGFNDQLDTLSFAAQGVSQTMLAELVPSLSAGLQSLNAFIADAGGAEEVLSDLATIGGTLASVYAGRVTASFAGSTTALAAKTVASIKDARAEAAAAQAVARRTAAELASAKALLNTARLEAQATKGTAAHTFALNQLSAARRRAATAAGAHNTATAASTAAMARAGVAARGLAGALTLVGGPLGLLVGGAGLLYVFRDELGLTQVQIGRTEDELADLRKEMAQLSKQDLSRSLDSLNAALEEATLKAARTRQELAALRDDDRGFGTLGFDAGEIGKEVRGMQALADAQADLRDIEEQRDAARRERLARISAEIGGFKTLSEWMPQVASGTAETSEEFDKLKLSLDTAYKAQQDYAATVKTLDDELRRGSITQAEYTRLKGLAKEQLDAATGATKKAAASAKAATKADKEAAKAAEQRARALESLRQSLDPAYAAGQKLAESTELLDAGLANGTVTLTEYLDLWAKAADVYGEATTGTDKQTESIESLSREYDRHHQRAKKLQSDLKAINKQYAAGAISGAEYQRMVGNVREEMRQVSLEADPMAQELASAWEEAGKRVDETFADAFTGAFDSFDDFADQLLDGFKRLLGELAYQATLKPIVVSVTGQMQGMFGGGGQQAMLGQQGGGFGLDSLSPDMLSKGWDTVTGWFGGGGANAAAQSYAGSGWASSATSGGGWYGSATSSGANGGAAAGGWQSGLINAGYGLAGSWAGNEIGEALFGKTANSNYGSTIGTAIGTAILPGIGTGIGAALGSVVDTLFGSGSSPSAAYVQEKSQIDYGEWSTRLTSTGKFGFNIRDMKGEELKSLEEFGTAMAQLDGVLASTRTPEEIDSIKLALDEFNLSTGNVLDEGVDGAFKRRLESIIDAGEYQFGELAKSASETLGELTKNITGLADIEVKLDGFGEQVGADVRAELERVAEDDLGVAIGSMAKALDAMAIMSASADRLNLAFDETAAGAVHAASYMQDIAGGVENLASIQQGYYQAAYSGNERLSRSQADLHETLSGVTDTVPQTVAELRGMVEAADLNTDAGAELALQLMQLAPALQQTTAAVSDAIQQQYQASLGRDATGDGLAYWMEQVSSGAITLEQALDAIANSAEAAANGADGAAGSMADMAEAIRARESLERKLLQAQGDTDALRERELDKLRELAGAEDQGLVALQERIWSLNDAAAAAKAAERAEQALTSKRQSLQQQLYQLQGNTDALRQDELDKLRELEGAEAAGLIAMQERIWALQDQQQADQAAQQSAQEAASLIERVEQARQSQLDKELAAIKSLDKLADSLLLSSQSTLDPAERLAEAQRQFAELQVRAEAGDTEAVGQLDAASQAYLDAASAYYGQSSSQYASIFDDVNSAVGDLSDEFESSVSELNRLGRKMDNIVDSANGNHRESLSALESIIGGLDWLPEGIGAEINRIMNGSTASGGSGGSNSGGSPGSGESSGNDGAPPIGGNLGQNTDPYSPEGAKEQSILDFLAASSKGRIEGSDFLDGMWELHLGDVMASFSEGGLLSAYRAAWALESDSSLPQFASGGAFTNGVVAEPTRFPMGLMGEAGPEAIMPLSNVGGRLGVDVSGAVDLEPLTRELHALRKEVAQLRAERNQDASHAAGQRNEQLREQRSGNRNSRLRRATV